MSTTATCKNGHPLTPENLKRSANKAGGGTCRKCTNKRARELRAERKATLANTEKQRDPNTGLITGPALDGWEDEYGPVPPPVPSYQWYDEVVVLRVLHGGAPVGRDLTPGEKKAIVKRGAHLTNQEISDRTGAKFSTINQWFKRYGEEVRRDVRTDRVKSGGSSRSRPGKNSEGLGLVFD